MIKNSLVILCYFIVLQANAQEDVFSFSRIGDTSSIKHLMVINRDTINAVNPYGHTPLILASYHNQKGTVAFLIRNGIDINYTFMQGSALHGAAFKGYTEVASILLENGIKVNVQDKNGSTPIIYATLFGHNELAKLLFEKGGDINIEDNTGSSAMEYAKSLENKELVDFFSHNAKER